MTENEVKKKLKELFEEVINEIAKEKSDCLAIWIEWVNGEPKRIDYEFGAGVCECGEWAYHCDICLDYEYERGKEDGRKECEGYYGV